MARKRGSKARPKRGRSALRSGVRTIAYEYKMFAAGCTWLNALRTAPPTPQVQFQRNLAIECALLHGRTLRDFFIGSGTEDDVFASDFARPLPRWKLTKLRSSSTRRRMNKLLAHASYRRSSSVDSGP